MSVNQFFMMMAAGKKLPYKQRLAYLESTGTQWINTGVAPSSNLTTSIQFAFTLLERNMTPFGSRTASGNDRYWANYDNRFEIGYGNYTVTSVTTTAMEVNTILFNEVVGNTHYFTYNGTRSSFSGTPNTTIPIAVFGRRVGDEVTTCKMQLYAMSLYTAEGVIRDFIPVLDWNDRPAMYDKVSGQMFYNQGTGTFNYA